MHAYRSLAGKVAVVTGAGRGIGASTAMLLAQAGAAVTLAARTASDIDSVARLICRRGGFAMSVPTNIANLDQVSTLVKNTVNSFGRLDFLINCAAAVEPLGSPAWAMEVSDWHEFVNVNLTGVFLLCRAVLPHMLRQGSGRLLMVSSSLGELPVRHASAYCAARAGANHFVRVVAAELHRTGVTANLIYPGIVETPGLHTFRRGLRNNRAEVYRAEQNETMPFDPVEPALLILWLCDPSTRRATGQTFSLTNPAIQRCLAVFRGHVAEWLDPEIAKR